eukprot:TRINITY_DN37436_c0_g1_i1.p1 TRINITY_DN37436_c0_g1~~TRINITY_DN37436_c0_g1_i1.p1  ORF type:complete len:138 (-),score=7.58 TRINITY_DN37436_c0_g1_i1:150-563(-)
MNVSASACFASPGVYVGSLAVSFGLGSGRPKHHAIHIRSALICSSRGTMLLDVAFASHPISTNIIGNGSREVELIGDHKHNRLAASLAKMKQSPINRVGIRFNLAQLSTVGLYQDFTAMVASYYEALSRLRAGQPRR